MMALQFPARGKSPAFPAVVCFLLSSIADAVAKALDVGVRQHGAPAATTAAAP